MKLVLSLALVGLMATACMGLTCQQTKSWATDGLAVTNTMIAFTINGFDACTDGTNPAFTLTSVTVTETPHHSSYSATFTNSNGAQFDNLQVQGNERVRLYTENSPTAGSAAVADLFYDSGAGIQPPVADPVDDAPDVPANGGTVTITLANFDVNNPLTFYGPGTGPVIDPNDGISLINNANPTVTTKTFTTAYTNFFAIFDDTDWTFYVRKLYTLSANLAAGLNVVGQPAFPSSGTVTADYNYAAVITGDPQFAGFQGQQFQVHGIPEEFFNLVSTPDFFINSRFVYLSNGFCDYNDTECFTHPGTYIDQLAFVMEGAFVKVLAGAHNKGLSTYVNNQALVSGNRVKLPLTNSSYVHVTSAREVVIVVDMFHFRVVNSDNFMNMHAQLTDNVILTSGAKKLMIADSDPAKVDKQLSTSYPEHLIHGLLGQTWRNVQYPHKRFIQGDATDYQVANLQSPNFVFSTYSKAFSQDS